MAEERNREKLSEMEQIHRGLEAFLEKEVYEERENGHQNGNRVYEAGQEERAGEIYPGEEQEFAFDRNANEEAYGGYVEEYNDSVYDNEEPVRMAMAKQNGNVVRTRQRENPEQASRAGRSGRGKSGGSGGSGRGKSSGSGESGRGKSSGSGGSGRGKSTGSEESRRGKSADSGGCGAGKGSRTSADRESSKSRAGGRQQPREAKQKKKHRGLRRFLTAVIVLLLAVTGLWYLTISHLYDKVEYAPTEILADEPMKEEGVTNILLIGNDSRAGGEDGRSDAMILVSISNRTKTIYLTSLLRDIYVEIPGHEGNRLNAAYSFGGPELLLKTIKQNLDIEVNRYVQVNFQAFANLIDAVGGVDLELTNEEVQLVNAYLNEYNMLENRPMDTDYLPSDASGLLHLNGPQALAYSRNRYIGSDFGRTERQRKILEAVFHQLPSSVLTNLDDMIDGILPNLTTNISKNECYALSLDAPKLLTYELVQASIPIAGSYQNVTIRKMSVLQVDFEKNKEFIRTRIYGEEGEQAEP
ncbi:MAG: LCP family protein [Acetatifactor sp.]|nr:LCP family protein [Acetatifactor sp.]